MNQQWAERCKAESTKSVVFLLQRIKLIVIGEPSGYEMGEACEYFVRKDDASAQSDEEEPSDEDSEDEEDRNLEEDETYLSIEEAFKHNLETDDGGQAVIQEFIPERVFLTREEAEAYAKSRYYNYRHGWQVYGLCCEGEMIKALTASMEVIV